MCKRILPFPYAIKVEKPRAGAGGFIVCIKILNSQLRGKQKVLS